MWTMTQLFKLRIRERKMKKKIVVIILSLFATASASAAAPRYYWGISYINAETEFMGETDEDSGFEARFGYVLNEYFSLEAGYLDLGTMELPSSQDGGGSFETDGYGISVLGTYPINNFNLVGKIGNLWWESEGLLGSIAGPVSYSNDGADLIYGVGLSYGINDYIDIKVEFNDSEDFNWSSLGINYRF